MGENCKELFHSLSHRLYKTAFEEAGSSADEGLADQGVEGRGRMNMQFADERFANASDDFADEDDRSFICKLCCCLSVFCPCLAFLCDPPPKPTSYRLEEQETKMVNGVRATLPSKHRVSEDSDVLVNSNSDREEPNREPIQTQSLSSAVAGADRVGNGSGGANGAVFTIEADDDEEEDILEELEDDLSV